jgi:hypothetical protein
MDGTETFTYHPHSIQDYYSVGDFERDCRFAEIFQKKYSHFMRFEYDKMITDGLTKEVILELRQNL